MTVGSRLWSLFMIATTLQVAESILAGLPIRAGTLDGVALHRALRGGRLPDPNSYLVVDDAMLDAIAEAGPFSLKARPWR